MLNYFYRKIIKKKTHGFRLPDWADPYYDEIVRALKWGFYFDYRLTEMGSLLSGNFNKLRLKFLTSKC